MPETTPKLSPVTEAPERVSKKPLAKSTVLPVSVTKLPEVVSKKLVTTL